MATIQCCQAVDLFASLLAPVPIEQSHRLAVIVQEVDAQVKGGDSAKKIADNYRSVGLIVGQSKNDTMMMRVLFDYEKLDYIVTVTVLGVGRSDQSVIISGVDDSFGNLISKCIDYFLYTTTARDQRYYRFDDEPNFYFDNTIRSGYCSNVLKGSALGAFLNHWMTFMTQVALSKDDKTLSIHKLSAEIAPIVERIDQEIKRSTAIRLEPLGLQEFQGRLNPPQGLDLSPYFRW
jgi:hypothetical protein